MLNLEPIKERLNKATPGPWRLKKTDLGWGMAKIEMLIDKPCPSGRPVHHPIAKMVNGFVQVDENAELIANCPTDYAAMIAEIEALKEQNFNLRFYGRQAVAHWKNVPDLFPESMQVFAHHLRKAEEQTP